MSTRAAPPPELLRPRLVEPIVLAALVLEDLLFSILGPLLPGYQRTLGLGDSQVGMLSGSYELGVVLGSLALVLLRRRGAAQRTAAAGLLGLGAATALFGFIDNLPVLLASRAVAGVMAAVCWSAAVDWLLASVPQGSRGRTMGRVMSATHAGTIGGPSIGALAAALGHPVVFGALGAAAALLGLALGRTPGGTPSPQAPAAHEAACNGQPDGRHALGAASPGGAEASAMRPRGRRAALDPVALACVLACNLASGAMGTFVPLALAAGGFGPGGIGAVATIGAVSGILWGPPAGWLADRIGSARTAIAGFSAMALLIAAATAVHSPFALAALALVCGWATMFAIVPSYLSASARAGGDTLTALAASQGFTAAGGFAGALLAGTLGETWGWRGGLCTVAAVLLVTAGIVGLSRAHDPLPRPPTAAS